MQETTKDNETNELGLTARAVLLRAKAREIKNAPILSKPAAIEALGEKTGELLIDICKQLDALTPYMDEEEAVAQS